MIIFKLPCLTYHSLKRIGDFVGATLLLILLSPFLVFIYIFIYAKMGSPVFYVQWRIGKNCIPFRLYKFRSMVNPKSGEISSFFTTNNDPRITKLGTFLRKYSIDELPQLWNVLIGDMSFIGPRPYVKEQSKFYSQQDWIVRHTLKPGISGLAQVAGRSMLTLNETLKKDLIYTRDYCFTMDVIVLVKTVFTLSGKASN